jgi:O-antigen/teichoic acid export membrane protein
MNTLLTRFGWVQAFGSVGFGAFSRLFALGSQFAVLILLSRLLPKADFGDFMIVFALTRVLSQGMGTGFSTLLVYHISRNASDIAELRLHRSVIALSLATNGIICIGLVLCAPAIAEWFHKPAIANWIVWLAPFALFSTLLTTSVGVFDGRGLITRSIVASEFAPNLIRLVALPPLLLLTLGNRAVAAVLIVSVAVPWLFIASRLIRRPDLGLASLTSWDLKYSGKLTLHSFAAMQMQGIDMLVVGWLFPSVVAADYAIASRIAALIPFFQQIIVKGFMAKAGRAIHEADTALLQREVEGCRTRSAMLVTATAVAALLAYPILLLFMNNFVGTLPLMAALTASPVVRSYFPGADALLRIAGFADFSLAIMLASAAFVVIFPYLFHQSLGIYSLALGMFVSATLLNPVIAGYLRGRMGIELATSSIWMPITLALIGCGLCMASEGRTLFWLAGVAVLSLSLIPTYLRVRRAKGTFL